MLKERTVKIQDPRLLSQCYALACISLAVGDLYRTVSFVGSVTIQPTLMASNKSSRFRKGSPVRAWIHKHNPRNKIKLLSTDYRMYQKTRKENQDVHNGMSTRVPSCILTVSLSDKAHRSQHHTVCSPKGPEVQRRETEMLYDIHWIGKGLCSPIPKIKLVYCG